MKITSLDNVKIPSSVSEMSGLTNEEIKVALLGVVEIMSEISRAAKGCGPMGLPLGPLYAQLMGVVPLSTFNIIIDKMIETGLFRRSNHCLVFVGGKNEVLS